MKKSENTEKSKIEYYVDESGDLTLFNSKGDIIIGSGGVSKYFIVGAAQIQNYDSLKEELENLRREILLDDYFKNIYSIHFDANKTGLQFHASKDIPEVRYLVM